MKQGQSPHANAKQGNPIGKELQEWAEESEIHPLPLLVPTNTYSHFTWKHWDGLFADMCTPEPPLLTPSHILGLTAIVL